MHSKFIEEIGYKVVGINLVIRRQHDDMMGILTVASFALVVLNEEGALRASKKIICVLKVKILGAIGYI